MGQGPARPAAKRKGRFFRLARVGLVESVRIKVRYQTPARRKKGGPPTTRAERYQAFNKPVPRMGWPRAADYLWDIFWKIAQERQSGPNGPQPLTSTTLRHWMLNQRRCLMPEEIDIIHAMDSAWCTAFAEEMAIDLKNAG